MLAVLLVIFSIGMIVAAHEFGHFIAAKLLGVRVKEFMLGLPSFKIVKVSWRGTEYGVTVLPIGGYVKFVSTLEKEDLSEEEKKEAFETQSLWKRVIIIFAGPIMNLIVPIFLIASIFIIGIPMPSTIIEKTISGFPAEQSGLKAGDKIVSIDGRSVSEWDEVTGLIQKLAGKKIVVIAQRDGERLRFSMKPIKKDSKGFLGIETKLVNERYGLLKAVYQGAIISGLATVRIVQALYSLLTNGQILSSLGSPIRITQELTKEVHRGYIFFLQSLAFISIGLALVNLIPLPPLDGGRILLLGVEGVIRKPIDKEKLLWIQAVGFLLLISLMIYLLVVDIQRLIPTVMRF